MFIDDEGSNDEFGLFEWIVFAAVIMWLIWGLLGSPLPSSE
jgi:hypothetical protein